ncbi:MAG: tetraacyldisaccharide 4'-kinase [Bacteroidetes bacterium]|nr:MAG: tetraacyldisaccharide 4'-kinase [Bacteroidota bacterium]
MMRQGENKAVFFMQQAGKAVLYPFTLLYGGITQARNALYDAQVFAHYQPSTPRLLNVGNLTVGGTGKTPHVEMFIRGLASSYKIATLSRGYGRKTKGFRIAQPTDSPATLGDEPYQIYQKFAEQVLVTVGEKRALAVQALEKLHPEIDLVLLDDAYQHRAIQAHGNILLTDYNRLFYNDLPFPAGRLREGRQGAKRADIIIVSKCPPDLPTAQRTEIEKKIRAYAMPETPIFFTSLRYSLPLPAGESVTLLTGIAHAQPLLRYLQTVYAVEKHWEFPDHYHYLPTDLQKITSSPILTTEKDFVKLSQPDLAQALAGKQVLTLPIEVYFLEGEARFWAEVQQLLGV